MTVTKLNKWFDMTNPGESYETYTRDSWEIPEAGTEIWCEGWKRGQAIKPYGDGAHVVVGSSVYHCDELMGILSKREEEGFKWGIDGVVPTREQQINGRWSPVEILTQGLSGNHISRADVQHIAEQVDTFLLDKDAFGYGEVFDNAEDFANREFRVSYMSDYLSSPEGRTDTIDHLQQIAENPKQVDEMVKQIESINKVNESEKKCIDSTELKEPRKPREKEREELER